MRIAERTGNVLKRIVSDGFAVIPGVFPDNEIAALAEELKRSNLPRSKAGIRHAMRQAGVAALALDQRLLAIAIEVLGHQTFPYRATLFDKSPISNWLVVWHQDTALPLRERREAPGWGPPRRVLHIEYAASATVDRGLELAVA